MANEVERDTVDYRDPTPFDGSKLHTIEEISEAIRHKMYGKDVREPIAQQGERLAELIKEAGLDDDLRMVVENSISGSPTNIFNDNAEAPYDDLNTLPANKIVTYGSGYNAIKNIPEKNNAGATVLTFNYRSDDDAYTGAVQLAYQPTGQSFYRVSWGTEVNWGSWRRQGESVTGIGIRTAYSEMNPDDLDLLPDNSIVTISYDTKKVLNFPVSNYSGGATIATTAYSQYAVAGGSVQVVTLADGRMFRRIKWGSPTKYRDWFEFKKNSISGDRLVTELTPAAPYDDLNDLINNSVTTFSEVKNVKNRPTHATGEATLLTYGYADFGLSKTQFLTQKNGTVYVRMTGTEGSWGAWRTLSDDYTLPSIATFEKIGVIGDSYASGYTLKNESGTEHYSLSWPQVLARKNGVSAINFSKGGLTTRSWLSDDKGLTLLNSSEKQDLYVLNLGINDARLGLDYLGDTGDIESGSDTYYGNYAKIINAVTAKAPEAKIVLATMPFEGPVNTKFNEAVIALGDYYGIPVIELKKDALFTSSFFNEGLIGGHPTITLYSAMSNSFERLLQECVTDHGEYFNTI